MLTALRSLICNTRQAMYW